MDTNLAYEKVTSKSLTHEQKVMGLAKIAENSISVLNISERAQHFFDTGAINDLWEGAAPYRPRYTMPDYHKFVKNGSEFLGLKPPADLDELIFSLMILYRHIPSITNFPVFLGELDKLIDPFITDMSDEEVMKKLKLFLSYLDKTINDSFCHATIEPVETRAGRLLLKVAGDMQSTVPNWTIKYNSEKTPDSFLAEAIRASLKSSNPAICNDVANSNYYDGDYGVASCYNILPNCGGAYTLTRITPAKLALEATSVEHFINELMPEVLEIIADYMNQRITFLVEKSGFFESSFLIKEGLMDKDRFLAMFGVTGLAECVNILLQDKGLKYGIDKEADDLAVRIMDKMEEVVNSFDAVYSPLTGGKFLLHAQVGLGRVDTNVSAGVRIPIGDEPEDFSAHLRHSGRFHKYFPTGVGDIFPIAPNVVNNPESLVDVVKGAFSAGVHYMSFYSADTDVVRISGYLVKRSEMEKFKNGEAVINDITGGGAEFYEVASLGERKVRML